LGITLKIFFTCISFCVVFSVFSQESFQSIQPIELAIKEDDYSNASNEIQIFSSLAINNIKNIDQVKIYLKGELLVNIQRDKENHLFAYIKMINHSLSGEIYFRDFLIDTLLMPLAIEGTLRIWNNFMPLIEMPIEVLLSGGVLDLEIIEKKIMSFEELSLDVTIERFLYSDQQLIDYMKKASIINSYYSYNEVLEILLTKFQKQQINRSNPSSSRFIAWHQINRINSYIDSHNFTLELQLEKNDPQNFQEKRIKSLRLEKRTSTLFTKELRTGRKGKLLDRNDYCKSYVDISKNYIDLAKKYPPNMVSAFNELVNIYPVEADLVKMIGVAKFYDVFKISGNPSTTELIYNYFIEYAEIALKHQEYLNALSLLRNANEVESFFNGIEKSEKFTEVYINSLDGLMSSFLKVSVMAYRARNFKIAKKYYQSAQQIYNEHITVLGNEISVKYSFSEFVEKQVELAEILMDDNYYEEAIELLDQAKGISELNSLELDRLDFESNYKKGYSKLYELLVDSVEYYIERDNNKNSLSSLLYSDEFENSHSEYLSRDERITSYALILFNNYYKRGLDKLGGSHPENAIDYLKEAKKIDAMFLQQNNINIDSLISQAVVPIIMQIIRKAEFEVWAKRLEKAHHLREEAVDIQLKYYIVDNKEVNDALNDLDNKIKNRICVDIQYKINKACRNSVNRINSEKFEEAKKELNTAESLLDNYPDCRVNKVKLDSLLLFYQPLFRFIRNYDTLISDMQTVSFSNLVGSYSGLLKEYKDHELNDYVDELLSLLELLEDNGNIRLYIEAINYYNENKEYTISFMYLNLLRIQHVEAKITREYQKLIGHEICKGKANKETFIKSLTKNDIWFKTLQKSCLKN